MAVVALHRNRKHLVRESPAIAARGLETTECLADAKLDFADQAAIDTYVAARGGPASTYLAMTLP